MANNRMAIVCPCGGYLGIAKHFGAEWSVRAYRDGEIVPELLAEHLQAFLAEHRWCEPNSDGTHFRLQYEHAPDS